MTQIRQADIARYFGLPPMAICRAVEAMGRRHEPLSEPAILALLTAGELNRAGVAWPVASELARRFEGELLYLARDPENRAWLVCIERPDQSFWVSCLSASHLDSILNANPVSPTLALRGPVTLALEALQSLQLMKGAA